MAEQHRLRPADDVERVGVRGRACGATAGRRGRRGASCCPRSGRAGRRRSAASRARSCRTRSRTSTVGNPRCVPARAQEARARDRSRETLLAAGVHEPAAGTELHGSAGVEEPHEPGGGTGEQHGFARRLELPRAARRGARRRGRRRPRTIRRASRTRPPTNAHMWTSEESGRSARRRQQEQAGEAGAIRQDEALERRQRRGAIEVEVRDRVPPARLGAAARAARAEDRFGPDPSPGRASGTRAPVRRVTSSARAIVRGGSRRGGRRTRDRPQRARIGERRRGSAQASKSKVAVEATRLAQRRRRRPRRTNPRASLGTGLRESTRAAASTLPAGGTTRYACRMADKWDLFDRAVDLVAEEKLDDAGEDLRGGDRPRSRLRRCLAGARSRAERPRPARGRDRSRQEALRADPRRRPRAHDPVSSVPSRRHDSGGRGRGRKGAAARLGSGS